MTTETIVIDGEFTDDEGRLPERIELTDGDERTVYEVVGDE